MALNGTTEVYETKVLDAKGQEFGSFEGETKQSWVVSQSDSPAIRAVRKTAKYMQTNALPVGFPTETVYGLGADATRSEAVKGIYKAKGRPSDNPLIIHICDLNMLRAVLVPRQVNGDTKKDPIPAIYQPLIERFWPGPLTILLPNPPDSNLAPEVTAGLPTFGVRMPKSPLALTLISLAGVPLAAPSANASTKPSPTTAQHVLYDLNGRIEYILDGGACQVGVESTVVDGLCSPPVVLRPGGLSIDDIRSVPGWEETTRAYQDATEVGSAAPRAPGMKYKHYSPKARVVLYEHGIPFDDVSERAILADHSDSCLIVGVIRTKRWQRSAGWGCGTDKNNAQVGDVCESLEVDLQITQGQFASDSGLLGMILDVDLGSDAKSIAHGLFSALRALDLNGASVIYVEGIADEGDIAAAVMNRLRKAATDIRYKQ